MIEASGIRFGYPLGEGVFDGLDFSLQKGGKMALAGPTGSGKSTLMHLLMGLLRPEAGTISVFGRARRSEADFVEVRRRIGLLFQDPDDQLFCPTVEEDIAFGPLNLGVSHAEARALVRETCAQLGIEGLRSRVIHRLSGGEKRLVAFATVIAMKPECLLLDEPTAGLDDEKTDLLLTYLKEHADTYVISSHDRDFISASTDSTFMIDRHRP
jgi:cobalt/nickel transport system ATP-binding protein